MSEHPTAHQRGKQLLLAAAAYFGIVFGVGFVLGSVRVPVLVPRFGERMAELAEMPFMFLAIVLAAGYIVRRYGSTVPSLGWFVVGAVALAFLVVAELLLAVVLAGRGVSEYVASRDPVSGSVYLAMLLVFAAMPWLRHRLGSAKSGVAHVDDVDLRMLDLQADLPLLERWLRSPHVVQWWGTPDLHFTALARRSRDTHAVITADGRPVGYLCWQSLSPSELEAAGLTDLPENLVDIDILIGEPELLGRGIGPRALVLLLARLHREGVEFAGLGTSTSNRGAIRAFGKAGFGLFREFQDPESGPCRYMVAPLRGAVEQPGAADRAARR